VWGGCAAWRGIATAAQRATYEVLHIAGLAAEPLRAGLATPRACEGPYRICARVTGPPLARSAMTGGCSPTTARGSTTRSN
jgi:two-component system LytT family sensor kinase